MLWGISLNPFVKETTFHYDLTFHKRFHNWISDKKKIKYKRKGIVVSYELLQKGA